jgi:hypothetical protein
MKSKQHLAGTVVPKLCEQVDHVLWVVHLYAHEVADSESE